MSKLCLIASVIYSLLSLTASFMSYPNAKWDVIAEDIVQPVPWVFFLSILSPSKTSNKSFPISMSTQSPFKCPPYISTYFGPKYKMIWPDFFIS